MPPSVSSTHVVDPALSQLTATECPPISENQDAAFGGPGDAKDEQQATTSFRTYIDRSSREEGTGESCENEAENCGPFSTITGELRRALLSNSRPRVATADTRPRHTFLSPFLSPPSAHQKRNQLTSSRQA